MIYGIGIDIVETARLKRWIRNPKILSRFFNEKEIFNGFVDSEDFILAHENALCQHYAVRFAAKEAFSKALGTGLCGFNLSDVFIQKNKDGKPDLVLQNSALEIVENRCKNANILVTLSHEKNFAVASVIIEVEKKN